MRVTADHKILKLDDESRNEHQNTVIVQDGCSQWLQSYPTKSKDAQETTSYLRRVLPPIKSQEASSQTIQRSSPKRQDLQWTQDTNTPHYQKLTGSQKELFDE